MILPTRIYLVRHAETIWNLEGRFQGSLDSPLSERGARQAQRLAEAFRRIPVVAVYSSPLPRALKTAQAIGSARGLSLVTLASLREVNLGAWEGRRVVAVAAEDADVHKRYREAPESVRFPGGETLIEVAARSVGAFSEIVTGHRGRCVAVVAHGGVNRTIMLHALGASLSDYWQIGQASACLNVIEHDGVHARVLMLNETSHLGPDA